MVAAVPKSNRIVPVMNFIADVVDPALGELLRRLVVELFNVLGGARLVLGADVDRQIAGLAAGDEQPFDGRKIGLGRAVLLENVTPSTSAYLEIQASPGFSGSGDRDSRPAPGRRPGRRPIGGRECALE